MLSLLVFTCLVSVFRATAATDNAMTATTSLRAVDFEVFGRVQGVFFRKHTKEEADKLGLRGWCRNTSQGTVQGHMQGPNDKIEAMMNWLKTKGSPSSQISKAEFSNHKDIHSYEFDSFDIRKDY